MQVRHKSLSVEFCEPPFATRTPEFRAAFPLGKVPTLELDDGQMIGESSAIMMYLESLNESVPMMPESALAQAQNEMIIRYVDNHLAMALSPLFQEFFGFIRSAQEPEKKPTRFDLLRPELEKLNRLLAQLPTFQDRDLQTGDLCLASNLYYVEQLSEYFGVSNILDDYPQVRKWQDWIAQFSAITETIDEMDVAHQAVIKQSKVIV